MLRCVQFPGEIREIAKSPIMEHDYLLQYLISVITIWLLSTPIFSSRNTVEKCPKEVVTKELSDTITKKSNDNLVRKTELLFSKNLMVVNTDLLAGVEIKHRGLLTYQSV